MKAECQTEGKTYGEEGCWWKLKASHATERSFSLAPIRHVKDSEINNGRGKEGK